MGTIYALMVGIDRYDSPKIPDLHGCRNDVLAATEVLRQRAAAGTEVRDVILLDGEATGAAIVEGFRTHLAQAGPGDVAVFWFSGHGSTHPVPEVYWHLEPDGRMETLVCADSRVDGRPDLLDKELALLLDDVCEGGAHVVAVLDSCHSGGAMREYRVRSADQAGEPFERHLLPDLAERYAAGAPAARHVTLAACQKDETAVEEQIDDVHHGRFTWALLRALRRAGPEATYRELLAVAQGEVERRSATQHPLVFPPGTGPADRRLLGGEAIADPPAMLMRYGRDGWEVNAGAAHGVEAGRARFAAGGPDPAGNVDVTRAEAGRSLVAPAGWEPDTDRVYPVELRRPSRPTLFGLAAGLAPGLAASLRAAVAAGDPHVRIVADAEDAELLIGPARRGVRLTTGNGEVIADVPLPPTAADLRHVARWWRVRSLRNRDSGIAGGVLLEVVEPRFGEAIVPRQRAATPLGPDGALRLAYGVEGGEPVPPGRFLRLRNTTDRPLYCVLLDLTERFKIDGELFRSGRIEPGDTAAAHDGQIVEFFLPADLEDRPGSTYRDWLMLIVSTDKLDARPYELPALDQSREIEPEDGRGELTGDWWTSLLKVVTAGPQ